MKNKMQEPWYVSAATLGEVRYSPAPGSVASALTLPLVVVLYHLDVSFWLYGIFLLAFAFASYFIIDKSLPYFDSKDPKEIVLDECLGMLITFWGIPLSAFSVIVGFLLFRVFDISKFFGIRALERIPGAWGILADDIAAGLLALLLLRFLMPIICVS